MKNSTLPEIIFASSDKAVNNRISRLVKQGQLKKLAPRIYTSNLIDSPEFVIRRNIYHIIGTLFPEAVLSFKSAMEPGVNDDNNTVFLTYGYNRKIILPGVILQFIQGEGPIEGDNIFNGKLYMAQEARMLLENLSITRGLEKTVGQQKVEERIETIISTRGEEAINEIRDKARTIATKLELSSEYKKLESIIASMLKTQTKDNLISTIGQARAAGEPFDRDRVETFRILFEELQKKNFIIRKDQNISETSFWNFSFFESYFSNYIEGTKFELEEAKKIVDTNQPLPLRNDDSHDFLGTMKLTSSRNEMKRVPSNPEELFEILLHRHKVLLSARTQFSPGHWKDKNNRAGNTEFVDFKLVKGTLKQGFNYYNVLEQPFAKAAFMMFLISEVHPSLDGNGRVARLMMNSELVKADQSKIIIPNVFREDYLGALRKLSRLKDPLAYIRMLDKAHAFSHSVHGDDFYNVLSKLKERNSFEESIDGNQLKLTEENKLSPGLEEIKLKRKLHL